MAKHKSNADLINFVYQVAEKFKRISGKWERKTGNPLRVPESQQKNLKMVADLTHRLVVLGKRWHDDKEIERLHAFAEWVVAKAAELDGQQPRAFAFDPKLFIETDKKKK